MIDAPTIQASGERALEVELHAPTLALLFERAARTLAGVWAGEGPIAPTGTIEPLTVRAGNPERLLVEFLNALIRLTEHDLQGFPYVLVEHVSSTEVQATAHGADIDEVRIPVKAAREARLIDEDGAGIRARILLDV